MFVTTSGMQFLSQDPKSHSRKAQAADWWSWFWRKCLVSTWVYSHPSSFMVSQILKPTVFLLEPRAREQCYALKTKVPVPCDLRVRRSRGDAREGDWLLVVRSGIEGLLEYRQHWRDCRQKQERGEESTWRVGRMHATQHIYTKWFMEQTTPNTHTYLYTYTYIYIIAACHT